MVRLVIDIIVLIVLADTVIANQNDTDVEDSVFSLKDLRYKKKKKNQKSTSSESGFTSDDSKSDHSLKITSSSDSSSLDTKERKYRPKSSFERPGWRKWHRKCTRCPEDEKLKWRDPRIKWICGEYQRARRSFKSRCTMHYRNCQDGTMFTLIASHRCRNESVNEEFPHGDHFFYEYKVRLSDDSTSDSKKSKTSSSSSSERNSDHSSAFD